MNVIYSTGGLLQHCTPEEMKELLLLSKDYLKGGKLKELFNHWQLASEARKDLNRKLFAYGSDLVKLLYYSGTDVLNYLESINKIMFQASDVKGITIPSNIKIIAEGTFEFTNLEKITIKPGLQIIGHRAFAYTDIKEIYIPDSVTQIHDQVFLSCSHLEKVSLPKKCYVDTKTYKELEQLVNYDGEVEWRE